MRAARPTAMAAAMAVAVVLAGGCSGTGSRHGSASPTTTPRANAAAGASSTTGPPTTPPLSPPTTATTVSPPPTRVAPPITPAPPTVTGPGFAIGDSVLEDVALYAPTTLNARGITIDAAVGRQWTAGVGVVNSMRTAGRLPQVVIVALGTNGRITPTMFNQMMQACAGATRVVFMTVTGPLIANNPIIRAGVARYRNAVLADWNILAAAHPAWFGPDHVHLGPAGATALGDLLAQDA